MDVKINHRVRDVMVIVLGKGHCDTSSNPVEAVCISLGKVWTLLFSF